MTGRSALATLGSSARQTVGGVAAPRVCARGGDGKVAGDPWWEAEGVLARCRERSDGKAGCSRSLGTGGVALQLCWPPPLQVRVASLALSFKVLGFPCFQPPPRVRRLPVADPRAERSAATQLWGLGRRLGSRSRSLLRSAKRAGRAGSRPAGRSGFRWKIGSLCPSLRGESERAAGAG